MLAHSLSQLKSRVFDSGYSKRQRIDSRGTFFYRNLENTVTNKKGVYKMRSIKRHWDRKREDGFIFDRSND